MTLEELKKSFFDKLKKDQWSFSKNTPDNLLDSYLEKTLRIGGSVEIDLIFNSQEWLTTENYKIHLERCLKILKYYDSQKEKGLNEDNVRLLKTLENELYQIKSNLFSDHIASIYGPQSDKLHYSFIDYALEMYEKPSEAWNVLKRLADRSRGMNDVEIPNFRNVYLKRSLENPSTEILYKDESFANSNEGIRIKKRTFDSTWRRKKIRKKSKCIQT